jgi:hypothetical protein
MACTCMAHLGSIRVCGQVEAPATFDAGALARLDEQVRARGARSMLGDCATAARGS